jgi:hypothetical protein
MKTKQLQKYYNSFYDTEYLRDFRAISTNDNIINKRFLQNRFKSFQTSNLIKWIINLDKKCNRSLYSEIYPTKTLEEYNTKISSKGQITVNKTYDRLFFDFDFDKSPEVKELSKDINIAINNNDTNLLKELREQFKAMLLEDKIAIEPFNDIIKLYCFLKEHGINPYTIFSGSKGFHLYIFYPKTDFKDRLISDVSYSLAKAYKKTLKLNTIDLSVNKDAYSRIHRIPYTKHLISDLYCYPINPDHNYSQVIENAINPEIKPFNLNGYQTETDFTDYLLKIAKKLKTIKAKELEQKQILNQVKRQQRKKKGYTNDIDLDNIDCRTLAQSELGSPEYTNGNLNRYNCCFHNDNKPSLSVYKERFICGVCGTFNYYDFIKERYGLSDKNEIIKKLVEVY